MPASKEELTERAQLVRIHEANCHIEYPSADELKFRLAIMKRIGVALSLRELRPAQFTGPAATVTRPPARAGGKGGAS